MDRPSLPDPADHGVLATNTYDDGSHNYENIHVGGNTAAVFGNVINHYHSYHATDVNSRERRVVDETPGTGHRNAKNEWGGPRAQLIQTFQFEGMWERHETIVGAAPGTCRWVLGESTQQSSSMRWSLSTKARMREFSDWFESSAPYFWIRGTAGSGKSTLLQYIVNHTDDIKSKLSVWAGTDRVFFASFFFWRHGTFLQKSINGMLRTLLVQLLGHVELPEDFFEEYQNLNIPRPWTRQDLMDLLRKALSSCNGHVCLFIDALDEFHGYGDPDHLDAHATALQETIQDLLDLLEEIWQIDNVKVCVASRPGNEFESIFGESTTLDLQTANEQDIAIYVENRLKRRMDPQLAKKFYRSLVDRSRGVFLWTKLAVDSLLQGYGDEDDYLTLHERLDEIPIGLTAMYRSMIERIPPRYRSDAGHLFSLLSIFGDLFLRMRADFSLVQFSSSAPLIFLCWVQISGARRQLKGRKNIKHISKEYMRKVLNSRCAGLLYLQTDREEESDTADGWNGLDRSQRKPSQFEGITIQYIHRSAQEFLEHNAQSCGITLARDGIFSPTGSLICASIMTGIRDALEIVQSEEMVKGLLLEDLIEVPVICLNSSQKLCKFLYLLALRIQAELHENSLPIQQGILDEIGRLSHFLVDTSFMAQDSVHIDGLSVNILSRALPLTHLALCGGVIRAHDYISVGLAGHQPQRASEVFHVIGQVLQFIFKDGTLYPRYVEDFSEVVVLAERARSLMARLLAAVPRTSTNLMLIERMYRHVCLNISDSILYWGKDIVSTLPRYLICLQHLRQAIRDWMSSALDTTDAHVSYAQFMLQLNTNTDINGSAHFQRQTRQESVETSAKGAEILLHVPLFSTFLQMNDNELDSILQYTQPAKDSMSQDERRQSFSHCYYVSLLWLARAIDACEIAWEEILDRIGSLPDGVQLRRYNPIPPCAKGRCPPCEHEVKANRSSKVCVDGNGTRKHTKSHRRSRRRNACQFSQLLLCGKCPPQCPGCVCDRAVYTFMLRQVLREDELDWENWFDVLIENYGVTQKEFQDWRERRDVELDRLREEWPLKRKEALQAQPQHV